MLLMVNRKGDEMVDEVMDRGFNVTLGRNTRVEIPRSNVTPKVILGYTPRIFPYNNS